MASGLIEQIVSGDAPALVPLTVEQYHRLRDDGFLVDGDPIELVAGLLVRKNRAASGEPEMTHGPRHAFVVKRLVDLVKTLEAPGWHSQAQFPVTLSAVDEPEPDLAIVRGSLEAFSKRHPGPADLLVVVEVADSSLRYDRVTKQGVYAAANIPTYVIVNIPEDRVELYEEPRTGEGRYARRTDYRRGETLALPLAEGRNLPLAVSEILGPQST